jgi:hypothetical protein
MNDFKTLTDAFGELERRADAATAAHPVEPTVYTAPRHRSRLLLMAASVVGVLAVAGSVALLTRDHSASPGPATRVGDGAPSSVETSTTPPPAAFEIPQTADDLAARFAGVLRAGDNTATFTVTDTGAAVTATAPTRSVAAGGERSVTPLPNTSTEPNGAAIVGKLTSAGVTGGFDLQIYKATPSDKVWCDDPDSSRCTISDLPDGSSVAVGRDPLPNSPDGITYEVALLRPDGVMFLMHTSNEPDPKGAGQPLAAHPPLTTDQMVSIVTSERW